MKLKNFIVFLGLVFVFSSCSKVHRNSQTIQSASRSGVFGSTAQSHPWWDMWPRPTGNPDLGKIQSFDANMVVGGVAATDEGRGPYFREIDHVNNAANLQTLQNNGIHVTGWIESQGQTRAFIGAVHKLADGSYEQDPAIGAAKLIATNWSWGFNGPGIDADANTVIWLGLQSFVNNEPWLGPYVLSQYPSIMAPTYPDGRPATGYMNNDNSDPRNAYLYDALASKGIDGSFEIGGGYIPNLGNYTGMLQFDGQPNGDFSFGKDTVGPFWLSYAKNIIDYAVAHDSNGFWMDNSTGWDFISSNPTTTAFGNWSVAEFPAYLQNHGIPAPGGNNFDIKSYLQQELLSWHPSANPNDPNDSGWSDARFLNDPIWRAFMAYKGEAAHNYTKANYMELRAAAQSAGKDPDQLYLGGNDVPGITFGALNGDEMDQVNTEYDPGFSLDVDGYGRGLPPTGHTGPFYTTAASLERSQHAIIWYYLNGSDVSQYLNHPNLGQVLGFEAVANNALINLDTDWGKSPGTQASINFVNKTVERLTPVLGYRLRKGAVAIVYGSFTQPTTMAPGGYVGTNITQSTDGSPSHLDSSLGFSGWAEACEDLHIPYRVIPDYKLPGGIPSDVSVLILPHLRAMDPDTVQNVLIPFARSGGTILVSGGDAGIFGTRDSAYADNGRAILVDLTNQDLSPGKAIFVQGNPGFDYYVGNRANQGQKSAGLAAIHSYLDPLISSGKLPVETNLNGWGQTVRVTKYQSEDGSAFLYDFLNVNIDLGSDTITPSSGGTVTLSLPSGWDASSVGAHWYDADGSGKMDLPVSAAGSSAVSLTLPGFRVYGTLVLDQNAGVTISNAGTGCDDNYCLWITGSGFDSTAQVMIEDPNSGATLATYSGDQLSIQSAAITLRLAPGSAEYNAVSTGLVVQVHVPDVNETSNKSPVIVRSGGGGGNPPPMPTATPMPTAPPTSSGPMPSISNAGTGCDDNYCLWITGSGFDSSSTVMVEDPNSGAVLGSYSGNQLSVQPTVITLRLAAGSAEYNAVSSGVVVQVRNTDSNMSSGKSPVVTRPGSQPQPQPMPTATPLPPSGPTPVLSNAGTGCDDNYCVWITGSGFDTSSQVQVIDPSSNQILATYAGAQLAVQSTVITLRLNTGSAEYNALTGNGLMVRVSNGDSMMTSGTSTLITRPASAPPSLYSQMTAAASTNSLNFDQWNYYYNKITGAAGADAGTSTVEDCVQQRVSNFGGRTTDMDWDTWCACMNVAGDQVSCRH